MYNVPNYASVAGKSGSGVNSWSVAGNFGTNVASSGLPTAPYTTDQLNMTGFGFGIPSTATILGIKAEVIGQFYDVTDFHVYLIKAGTIQAGTDRKTGATPLVTWNPYGGSTDLWGNTWTPADINNSGFGLSYAATGKVGGTNIVEINNCRITVYWSIPTLAVNKNMPKSYIYKVYASSANGGNYLGNLPNVISEFGFTQAINTNGVQINVESAVSADTNVTNVAANPNILDESSNAIMDENGNNITSEFTLPVVAPGNSSYNAIIKNGNSIQIWEYSYYHPNGQCMFLGDIENWGATFGGADGDTVKMVCYSDGQDMDNHLVRGYPFAYTADQSQTTQDTPIAISGSYSIVMGQTFIANTSTIGAISLYVNEATGYPNVPVTVNLYDGINLNNLLATSTQSLSTADDGGAVLQFTFPYAVAITAGSTYAFTVTAPAGVYAYIYSNSAGGYSGGAFYGWYSVNGIVAPNTPPTAQGGSLYFVTYNGNGSTASTYTSVDPTTGVLLPLIMPPYKGEGGVITASSSTIQATGLSLTFGFNTQTVNEAVQEVLSFAPNGFYYYVDIGTDIFYFKQTNTVADIILTKGVQIGGLNLSATIEKVKNAIFFTGGNIGTTNLYSNYVDSTSLGRYKQRLDRPTNNRIVTQTGADAIGNSELAELKGEQYQTSVVVLDKTMDISLFKPGMVIGYRGYGTFVDSLLMQIVQLQYAPGKAILTLGILPKRLIAETESVTRGLLAISTVANPTTPT